MDTIVSITEFIMTKLSLLSSSDVQTSLKEYLILRRKAAKLSRDKLALRSTVPASTIKKFETTGQISLRQFLLLWQCLEQLEHLDKLTKPSIERKRNPQSIADVLSHEL